MQYPEQLQMLAEQFTQWRQNKDTLGLKTPLALRQQAVELSQHYSASKIVTTLGLSGAVFKQWQTAAVQANTSSHTVDTQFVPLPETKPTSPAFTLKFDNGSAIEVSTGVPKDTVLRIVQACWE